MSNRTTRIARGVSIEHTDATIDVAKIAKHLEPIPYWTVEDIRPSPTRHPAIGARLLVSTGIATFLGHDDEIAVWLGTEWGFLAPAKGWRVYVEDVDEIHTYDGSAWQPPSAGSGSGDALTSDGLDQFASTTSTELRGVISDETGTGALVFATSPTLVTPALGTPASGTLTNCTGLPAAGVTGLGTLATQNGTFSGTSSGTNTGDQTITLSGDASGSGTAGITVTVANGAITTAKMGGDVTTAGKALLDDADAAAQRATLGLPVVHVAAGADVAVNSTSDVTIATHNVTGVAAGDQITVEGVFTLVNDSGAGRFYILTLDFDGLFDIEVTTATLTNSATAHRVFFFRGVLDVRSTSLAYASVMFDGQLAAGQASGADSSMAANNLQGKGWGVTASDATGTCTVALFARSDGTSATQTIRLHQFRVTKETP